MISLLNIFTFNLDESVLSEPDLRKERQQYHIEYVVNKEQGDYEKGEFPKQPILTSKAKQDSLE